VILREATAHDVEAILDIQQPAAILAFAHIFPQDEYPFPRAELADRWRGEIADPGIRVYVSTDAAGHVNGFAATRPAVLQHFGTAVATWGTGLARDLHDAVMRELAGTGATRVRLHVLEANRRARRFYEKSGWRPTGERTRSHFAPYPVLLEYEVALSTVD
jgi:RimJ/RimL family protein N-acetyltransferase